MTGEQEQPEFVRGTVELEGSLGSGALGDVFGCVLRGPNGYAMPAVLKQARPNEYAAQCLLREGRLLAKLGSHPNIVRLLDQGRRRLGPQLTVPFLLLERGGLSLDRVLAHIDGALPAELASYVAIEVCSALAWAHSCGVLHRDIKPANVLVGPAGEVRIIDFGISKADDGVEETTRDGGIKGTLSYVPPERFRGHPLDARGDLWSVGVLLYTLVAGRQPWPPAGKDDAASAALAGRILKEPHPPLQDVPSDVRRVVDRLLEKDPDERYQDAYEVLDALSVTVPWASRRRMAALVGRILRGEDEEAEEFDPSELVIELAEGSGEGSDRIWVDERAGSGQVAVTREAPVEVASIVISEDLKNQPLDSPAPPASRATPTPMRPVRMVAVSDSAEEQTAFVPAEVPVAGARKRRASVVAAVLIGAVAVGALLGLLEKRGAAPSGVPLGSSSDPVPAAAASPPPSDVGPKGAIVVSRPTAVEPEKSSKSSGGTASVELVEVSNGLRKRPKRREPRRNVTESAGGSSLEVVVLPRGSWVQVDGRAPVRAPHVFKGLAPGVHRVQVGLQREDLSETRTVSVKRGAPSRLRVDLVNPFAPGR